MVKPINPTCPILTREQAVALTSEGLVLSAERTNAVHESTDTLNGVEWYYAERWKGDQAVRVWYAIDSAEHATACEADKLGDLEWEENHYTVFER